MYSVFFLNVSEKSVLNGLTGMGHKKMSTSAVLDGQDAVKLQYRPVSPTVG